MTATLIKRCQDPTTSRRRGESTTLGVCVYIYDIYTHTPSVGDSLRRWDVTQWFKMRQYPDLTVFGNFGKAIKAVLTATIMFVDLNTLTPFFISILSCR